MAQALDTEHLAPWAQRLMAAEPPSREQQAAWLAESIARVAAVEAELERQEREEAAARRAREEALVPLGLELLEQGRQRWEQGLPKVPRTPEELGAISAAINHQDRLQQAQKRAEDAAWEADLLRRHGLVREAEEEDIAGQTWTCSRSWK